MKEKKLQLNHLIEFLQELASEKNGKYSEVEKLKFTEAINFLNELNEPDEPNDNNDSKRKKFLLKAIGSIIKAYVMHKIFEDDD